MAAIIDPRKVLYPPESLIEGLNIASFGTSGEDVASYQCEPFYMAFENVNVEAVSNVVADFGIDGKVQAMSVRADGLTPASAATTPGDPYMQYKLTAKKTASVRVKTTTGTVTNLGVLYNVTVRPKTIAAKQYMGEELTGAEEAIAAKPNINLIDNITLGRIPRPQNLLGHDVYNQFDQIQPYSTVMAAFAAGSDKDVVYRIDNPEGMVSVLLGIGCDASVFSALYSDSFFNVDRDTTQPNYMSVDISTMPDMLTVPCYVPFTKSIRCHISSATGTGATTVPAWFIVGIRRATIVDHIRWGNNFPPKSEQDRLDMNTLLARYQKVNISDLVTAGMI